MAWIPVKGNIINLDTISCVREGPLDLGGGEMSPDRRKVEVWLVGSDSPIVAVDEEAAKLWAYFGRLVNLPLSAGGSGFDTGANT